jgi:crotonobetainyl-CoA:carnitine CoA-transferase CaiB-like acyl-CoA transferase
MTMSDAPQHTNNTQTSAKHTSTAGTGESALPLPLEGIKVLDCARLVAGGCIGTLLGDFGAEVVKIEAPGKGDPLRGWAVEKKEFWWKVYARNKKSMTLNLSVQEGRDILLEMIPHFDVMIEGFVPGKLESWGLSPEVLLKLNPGLVLVRASGWGQTGPYSSRPGFGTLIESMSGFAHMTGMPEGPPTLPPLPLADMTTALYGTSATMFALFSRERHGGKGQVIDLSIYESMISILGPAAAEYQHCGVIQQRRGNRAPTNAPRNTYQSADGKWIAMSAATQSMAEKTMRAIGRPEMIDDPRFKTNEQRIINVEALDEAIQGEISKFSQADMLERFHQAGVTAAPVYDIEQLLADEHVQKREVIVEVPDHDLGTVKMHNIIPRLSGTPGQIRSTGPTLNQHGDEVLRSIGFSEERIAAAKAKGLF